MFYTLSGNVMTAIGAAMWWYCLACFAVQYRKYKITNIGMMFAIICLFFLFVYSLQYGGSLELRFRGVIYIITSAMLMCNSKEAISMNLNSKSLAAVIFITIVGTVAGI